MPFFYLECHYGDDNDNNIRDYVIEAPSAKVLWEYLENSVKEECGLDADAGYSGDDSLLCFYAPTDGCPEGSECADRQCDADHRMYHRDFYLISTHDTEGEANAERAYYHGQSALIRVDDAGKEINDGQ